MVNLNRRRGVGHKLARFPNNRTQHHNGTTITPLSLFRFPTPTTAATSARRGPSQGTNTARPPRPPPHQRQGAVTLLLLLLLALAAFLPTTAMAAPSSSATAGAAAAGGSTGNPFRGTWHSASVQQVSPPPSQLDAFTISLIVDSFQTSWSSRPLPAPPPGYAPPATPPWRSTRRCPCAG